MLLVSEAAGPGNKPNKAQMELRLVQSKHIFENPQIDIHAEEVILPSS
jgi:hypothetical protein